MCLQTPLTELKGPLNLKWKQGKYMPVEMKNHIHTVVIGDNVYVGGGWTRSVTGIVHVMVYSLDTGSWRELPQYKSDFFGMTAMNNQLVVVGGIDVITDERTNILGVWDEESQTWTHPFPEMPTSRSLFSVISYLKWIIVAGGSDRFPSNKVELLDTLSKQWYEGSPLPSRQGCSEMSSVINGNMWYLSGGFHSLMQNKQVFSVCLDELISQAVSKSAGTTSNSPSTSSPWQTLTETPQIFSNILVVNGALLAVGGRDSSAIHHYQPSSRTWVKVGDLPTERWRYACTVLPNGEIFVAGGYGRGNAQRVDIGAVAV